MRAFRCVISAVFLLAWAASAEVSLGATTVVDASAEQVVLKIDGTEYRMRDLSVYVEKVLEKGSGKDNVLTYLDQMIVDLVVSDDALREIPSLNEDPYVTQEVRRFLARITPNVLWEEEVAGKIKPTPAEIMKGLPDPSPRYELSVIVNQDEGKIIAARDALKRGEGFGETARIFSEGFAAAKGGSIGTVEEGKFDLFTKDEIEYVRSHKPGEFTEPFRSRIGWMIVKYDRYWSPDELKALDVKDNFDKYVSAEREKVYKVLLDDLYAKSVIAWDNDLVGRVRDALEKGEPISDAVKSSPIVLVNGEPIYPLELDVMGKIHSVNSLEIFLNRKIREELLLQVAIRQGRQEGVSRETGIARKRAVTRRFFKVKMASLRVTEKDLREFYERSAKRNMTEEMRRLAVIETVSRKKAEEALKKFRKGQDFGKLAASYNEAEENRKLKGDVGYVSRKQLQGAVADKVFSTQEGEIVGPLEIRGKTGKDMYALIRVTEIVPSRPVPFESMNIEVLRDRYVSGRMESFYREYLAKAYEGHKVEVFVNKSGELGGSDGG